MAGSEGRRRLVENIFSMFVLQGSNYIAPLVTIPYLVRVLGPADYGLLAFAQAFIGYFVIATEFGFNMSTVHDVDDLKDRPKALSEFVASVLATKLSIAILGFALMTFVAALIGRLTSDWWLFAASYVNVLGGVLFPVWLYRGLQRMKLMSTLIIIGRFASVIGIFALVHKPHDLLLAAFIQASALLISGIPAIVVIFRIGRLEFCYPRLRRMKDIIRNGWHLFISNTAVSLYTTTNVFVLGLVRPPVEVGYYVIANKLVTAVVGLTFPVADAVYPHLVSIEKKSREDAIGFNRRVFWLQLAINVPATILLFIFAEQIVSLISGSDLPTAALALKILAPVPILVGSGVIFGQLLLVLQRSSDLAKITMRSAVLNCIIIVPLSYKLGSIGTSSSLVLVELFTVFNFVLLFNNIGLGRYLPVRVWRRT